MDRITVLVVDDHPVIREGLRAMLATEPSLELVGEAADGQEALEKVAELNPAVVLMDIRLPRLDGIEATRRIKQSHPATIVIVFTVYQDDVLAVEAVRAGAGGYLLKDFSREQLIQTIRAALGGCILVNSEVWRGALNSLGESARGRSSGETLDPFGLTSREGEILALVADGFTNKEIGTRLFITEDTVKKHVQHILEKLQASDRTQAATMAVRAGLLGPRQEEESAGEGKGSALMGMPASFKPLAAKSGRTSRGGPGRGGPEWGWAPR